MKIQITEQMQYRLIGLIVILAIIAILAPAVLLKTNFNEHIKIAVKIPPKPSSPQVNVPSEQQMFIIAKKPEAVTSQNNSKNTEVNFSKNESVKIITPKPKTQVLSSTLAKVELKNLNQHITIEKAADKLLPTNRLSHEVMKKVMTHDTHVFADKAIKKDNYVVQLASFLVQTNATRLVHKLKDKGYNAHYYTLNIKGKIYYPVVVGQFNDKNDAYNLQQKLSHFTKLNGLIINKNIG